MVTNATLNRRTQAPQDNPAQQRQARWLPIVVIAGCLLSFTHFAHADTAGPNGYISSLQINESSSDLYAQWRGRILVETDYGTDEYRWGGTYCSGRNMSPENLNLLHRTLMTPNVQLLPAYKSGMVGSRCLVSFRILPDMFNEKIGVE